MVYLIVGFVSMFVLLGLSYAIFYAGLFIIWLISLFFDRDERRKANEETERRTEMFRQMTLQTKAQNEAMRQQIERKKIENQRKQEEFVRNQNKD